MTTTQKIIKYLAVAFALFLSINIISGICSAIFSVPYLFGKKDAGEMREYAIENDFTSLKIDINAADLEIRTGEKWKLGTNHEYITCNEEDESLEIYGKKSFFAMNSRGMRVVLTVPEETVFEYVDLDVGVGEIFLDELSANSLKLNLGVGDLDIEKLKVLHKAEIDSGIGDVSINDSQLFNAGIDMGIGELNYTGALMEESSIDYGIGETSLALTGNAEDHQIKLDKGVGEARLDGRKMKDDSVYGGGSNRIDIDGGIGDLDITFQ